MRGGDAAGIAAQSQVTEKLRRYRMKGIEAQLFGQIRL
jgi:hypothetical protein